MSHRTVTSFALIDFVVIDVFGVSDFPAELRRGRHLCGAAGGRVQRSLGGAASSEGQPCFLPRWHPGASVPAVPVYMHRNLFLHLLAKSWSCWNQGVYVLFSTI